MSVGEHNPSRRALLGAAVAIPLCGAGGRWTPDRVRGDGEGSAEAPSPLHHSPAANGPPPSPPSRGQAREALRWRRALAAFEAAEAAVAAVERRSAAASHAGKLALEDEYGERLDALYAALRRLLKARAPDLAAFAAKVVLAIDHEVATLAGGEACLAAIRREALRLGSHAAGPAWRPIL